MEAVKVVLMATGAAMWLVWLLGAVVLGALWLYGKMQARGADERRVGRTGNGPAGDGPAPAPVPHYVTRQRVVNGWLEVTMIPVTYCTLDELMPTVTEETQ